MSSTPEQNNEIDQAAAEFQALVQQVRELLKAHEADFRFKMAVRVACPDKRL